MPRVVHKNQTNLDQHRFSKAGLVVLLLAMTIGLAFWLFNSLKKKEHYRKQNSPSVTDTTVTGKVRTV
jgi:hypothetical protein